MGRYKLYQVDFGIPPGEVWCIGYPQFVLEKEGCAKWIPGDCEIGQAIMEFVCQRNKKKIAETTIKDNQTKRVRWALAEGAFAAIGILDNELFHIEDYKTDSKNPAIRLVLDRVPCECCGPEKGFPELFVIRELKELGAKYIRYTMYKYPENMVF